MKIINFRRFFMADENKAGQQLIFVGHKKLMKISYFRRRAADVNKPLFSTNFFCRPITDENKWKYFRR